MTDTGLLTVTSIALYSTGHWIGGTVALLLAFACAAHNGRM